MEKTIIYVFGPKRLGSDYRNNKELPNDETGWLKIGLTTSNDENADKWDVAIKRIGQEVKTGISETCVLLDVFEYPSLSGKPDDEIRRLMTDDVYNLSNSKANNKLVKNDQYEIKAGQEFVYGASRAKVLAAIAKFERNLIIKYRKAFPDMFETLIELVEKNMQDAAGETDDSTNSSQQQTDDFWEKVIDKLPDNIKEKSNHSKGKNYVTIKTRHPGCKWYFLTYNVKQESTSVALETYDGGLKVRDSVESYIEQNNIRTIINNLQQPKQGTRNPNKYSWEIRGEYSGEEESVIQWFVENTKILYNAFESSDQ